ncbi:MAG: efflux RND transporter periplasmic adaptor subunit [Planctomycetia bacterium]|nr:efflux RND transporter periplasmic adaptor subunit [Planctomycetia bacterium]
MTRSHALDRFMVAGIVILGLAAIVGLVVVPHLGVGHHSTNETTEAKSVVEIPVTTTRASLRPVERRVNVVGTLEGFEEVSINPKVEGRVTNLYHDIGDAVSPGEPLLLIDDIDFRLAAAEAERSMELELARLGLENLNEKFDINRVAMVVRARDVEENARTIMERARRLGGGRGIGVEDLEKTQTEYRVAQSNRRQAELDALATLASARYKKAMLDTALQKRADALLSAPPVSRDRLPPGSTSGALRYVVAARKVAEGEMVRPNGPPLFRLVIDNPLKFVVTIPERHSSEVTRGQAVGLRVEAYPGQEFGGQVTRVNPTIDRMSRSFTAEVLVDNAEHQLRPGNFAKASILTRRAEQAVCVPEEAVVRFAGEVKVFVIEEGKARAVPVKVGESLPGAERWVEVSGALKANDEVVVTGHSTLANGTAVRVR